MRTLFIDGVKAGTVVMPQRGVGNWNDWGMTNYLPVSLAKGAHKITIEFMPYDENMNLATNHAIIDALVMEQR